MSRVQSWSAATMLGMMLGLYLLPSAARGLIRGSADAGPVRPVSSVRTEADRDADYLPRSLAASWPQAPSISRPRVSRTVTGTP